MKKLYFYILVFKKFSYCILALKFCIKCFCNNPEDDEMIISKIKKIFMSFMIDVLLPNSDHDLLL